MLFQKYTFYFFILLLFPQSLFADFSEHFDQVILPFYWKAPAGTLHRPGDISLVYKVFEHPAEKGAIVFITGWTETHLKYAEFIWELYHQGYSIYSIDNRGMGFSSRLTSNSQQVHVEDFKDYVADLNTFIEKVVQPEKHHSIYLVSHSMGGLIAAKYLAQNPHLVRAAVFSAPLFELNTGKISEKLAYQLTKSAVKKGKGKSYALTQGDTTFEKASDFSKQKTTHSLKRWRKTVANWKDFPILLQGGSTNQWILTVLENTFSLLRGEWNQMPVPTLLMQASDDVYVINKGQAQVCSQALNCQLKQYPQSYHELFMEEDFVRKKVIFDTLNFLDQH
jgi:lysophospholipase